MGLMTFCHSYVRVSGVRVSEGKAGIKAAEKRRYSSKVTRQDNKDLCEGLLQPPGQHS